METSASGFAPAGVVSASTNAGAAVNALTVLGYSPTDASALVARFDSTLPVEELIRLSLKSMGGPLK
jgi:Holliday junction DNA helicase RuvA